MSQLSQDIDEQVHQLVQESWANRLEAIDKLREIRNKSQFKVFLNHVISKKNIVLEKDFIQICEYLGKNTDLIDLGGNIFYGLITLAYNGHEEVRGHARQTIDELNCQENILRSHLVFSLQRAWKLCDPDGKLYISKIALKYNYHEIYSLVVRTIFLFPDDNGIKLQRVLAQARERRIVPALRHWLKGDDKELITEALRSFHLVGGLLDIFSIYPLINNNDFAIKREVACTISILYPSLQQLWLPKLWKSLKSVNERVVFLECLTSVNTSYNVRFFKEVLLNSRSNELSLKASFVLGNLRVPSKIRIMTSDFLNLDDDKKAKIITSLNGKPFRGAEAFYLKAFEVETNEIIKILIIEGMGYFDTPSVISFLKMELSKIDSQYRSFAYSSLFKVSSACAFEFCKDYIKDNTNVDSFLKLNILKTLPSLRAFFHEDNDPAIYLAEVFLKGSLNEKMLIVRAAPYFINKKLFMLLLSDFFMTKELSQKKSIGLSLIKSMNKVPGLIRDGGLLFEDVFFLKCFRLEKINPTFIEEYVSLVKSDHLKNGLFLDTIKKSILKIFLQKPEKFNNEVSLIYLVDELSENFKDFDVIDSKKILKLFFKVKSIALDKSLLRLSLLSGDPDDLGFFLENCKEYGLKLDNDSNLQINLEKY